ncbi:4'-phosphopantetheinyl transferase superfamily protein [Kribbella sandramycini]|uniref:4'-phosphopantetheinyl transferase EntD n=1 Tax=Kribbella sandramycini TaxID=60450 RepID=A0A7Y4L321_9ACTN|nr:4'-phosphopantetheinyl transferase superfamily protein [Kribbella sandramycini]MBB6571214.1 4'-phosphopantetheinyl transferase EntD [Kribbella sandramycini]NOL43379.1 4'-phosphopantetheinyl transferase superfamily protein [Kribbella sandramycini]
MRGRTGISALLPDDVEVVEQTSDVPLHTLLPAEYAAIARAVPKRRAEFATVRHCAREALARLGHPAAPIGNGKDREPLWPDGVVGSLTHCEGYRAAAVTSSPRIASIGIDAEVHQPLPDGVDQGVTVAAEVPMLRRLAAEYPAIHWGRVLFSAKESIYKAWYPLTQAWLDFTDCELVIDPEHGTFTGRILLPGTAIAGFDGRWSVTGGHVLTAVHQPGSR